MPGASTSSEETVKGETVGYGVWRGECRGQWEGISLFWDECSSSIYCPIGSWWQVWAPGGSPLECRRDVKTKAHEAITHTVVHLGVLWNKVIREESSGRTNKCCEKQVARKCIGRKERRKEEAKRKEGGREEASNEYTWLNLYFN